MQLIIGGAFQGKKEYAKAACRIQAEDMTDGAGASYEDIFSCTCMYHFHEWIRNRLRENQDMGELPELLAKRNPGVILISNELGYGVVPVDAFDRQYREATGRVCTRIAARADKVIRVTCGIGTVIKDG